MILNFQNNNSPNNFNLKNCFAYFPTIEYLYIRGFSSYKFDT